MSRNDNFDLREIPKADLQNRIGTVVYKNTRGAGPHWILKAVNGKKATLETPVSWKRSTAPVSDLRYDANETIKY